MGFSLAGIWGEPFPSGEWVMTTTSTSPIAYDRSVDCDCVIKMEPPRYFNCKRCGAVGQSGVCEFCGSAEE